MTTKKIVVKLPSYAEARPVAEIVQTASRFDSEIYLISGNKKINAKSIMGMMSLGLDLGEKVNVVVDGVDENDALTGIENYLSGK